LNNIELSFNDIWQIKKARSPIRKFSDYLAMMIITPFAIALSGSFTVKINQAANNFEFIQPMLKLVPFASIWILFTIIYIVMPNTKVKFKYALIAGIVAGSLSMFVQWGYFEFQVGVTRFNTLYGSFAAIPLFLLWLQITWLIVLMGAEISFAYQNIENYEFEEEALNLNHDSKRILTLLIAQHIVKNFEQGGKPKNNEQLSHELGIPLRLFNTLIFELTECNILGELATDSSKERTYVPAIDINKLTVDELYTRLEKVGGDHMIVTETDNLDKITKIHEHLLNSMKESPSNILIKDI
jgi:membrane protein